MNAGSNCGVHSRAFGGDCVLPAGHDGLCHTGAHAFLAPVDVDDEPVSRVYLTQRKRQAIWCIAHGMTTREMGAFMGVSESTAKHHVTELFDDLGVRCRELVLMRVLVEKRMTLDELTGVMP